MRNPITKEQILYEILPQAKLIYSAKKQISGCLEPRGEMRIDCTRTPVIFLGNNIVCCGLPPKGPTSIYQKIGKQASTYALWEDTNIQTKTLLNKQSQNLVPQNILEINK